RREWKVARQISQNACPRRSAVSREILFHARRPRISGMEDGSGKSRRVRLLGPMVSGSGAADRAARRRNYFLSDSHRLASIREKGIWRRAAFRLGNKISRDTAD